MLSQGESKEKRRKILVVKYGMGEEYNTGGMKENKKRNFAVISGPRGASMFSLHAHFRVYLASICGTILHLKP